MKDTNVEFVNYMVRPFYHADISHLVANAISFYNLSSIENIIGTGQFAVAIVFIWIASSMLLLGYHSIFPSRKIKTVGFSGVIFGLIIVYYYLLNNNSKILSTTSLIISILPQILVPGISFEGHVAGIFAGLIYVTLFRPKRKFGAISRGLKQPLIA